MEERRGEVAKIKRGSNVLIMSRLVSPRHDCMTVRYKYFGVIRQIHSIYLPEARIIFYSFVIPQLWVCDSAHSGRRRSNDSGE